MIVRTPGLTGALIAFVGDNSDIGNERTLSGYAIIQRFQPAFEARPYSTHRLYMSTDGSQQSEAGHYDLTLEEARADLLDRVGPRPVDDGLDADNLTGMDLVEGDDGQLMVDLYVALQGVQAVHAFDGTILISGTVPEVRSFADRISNTLNES